MFSQQYFNMLRNKWGEGLKICDSFDKGGGGSKKSIFCDFSVLEAPIEMWCSF